jgi:dCMP deaminase
LSISINQKPISQNVIGGLRGLLHIANAIARRTGILNMANRSSWHEYFLTIASTVASRATCPRLQVGSVIVKDKRIIGTGYNGSTSDSPHCTDVGCLLVNNSCQRTVHGETNALLQCAKHGTSVDGAAIYITHEPCMNCLKHIITSGIREIYFKSRYGTSDMQTKLDQLGIKKSFSDGSDEHYYYYLIHKRQKHDQN